MNTEMELERILNSEDINTVFQPIVSLENASIIGYEALSRGPADSELHAPNQLFAAAEKCNRLWELESLCRKRAIQKSINIENNKFLFLNVDPMIFKDEKFKKGFTKEFLQSYNISPDSIIFEITEKTAIEDYNSFRSALANYINQGYKIAIDDTGAGYSGMKTLLETKPHYIKIDIDLVRDIDKDSFKQALMKAFVAFSEASNMKIIAEGIETEEELITLINLGVYAGQGYYMQRPAGTFLDIPEEIKRCILLHNKMANNKYNYAKNYIGDIAQKDKPFYLNTQSKVLKDYFEESLITGVCIVKDNYPVGLVMKQGLNAVLATQYGVAVFSKRPVSLIMDNSPLIVDYYTPVSEVSKKAMSREAEKIYDYVIVTKDSRYYGIVTIKNLLEYTTTLERNYAMELNPLTGLPGNAIIEKVLNDIITCNHNCCILYFDLDNFKIYNDTYGFENGDKMLKFTAGLIETTVRNCFPYNSFTGHIGGDDFVCVLENSFENCDALCKELIKNFDENVSEFFNEKDKNNGYIEAYDRKGNKDTFGLTSISIAGLYDNMSQFLIPEEIGKFMSSIKKTVKSAKGSSYYIKNNIC